MLSKQTFNSIFSSITAKEKNSFILASDILDNTTIRGTGWDKLIPPELVEDNKIRYYCLYFLTPMNGLVDPSYIYSKLELLKIGITSELEVQITALIKRKQKQNIDYKDISAFVEKFLQSFGLNVLMSSLLNTYLSPGNGTELLIDKEELNKNSSIENHITIAFKIDDEDNKLEYINTYTKQTASVKTAIGFTTTNRFIIGQEEEIDLTYIVYQIEGDEHNENHLNSYESTNYDEALEYLNNHQYCSGIHARTKYGWIYDVTQELDIEKIKQYFDLKNNRKNNTN